MRAYSHRGSPISSGHSPSHSRQGRRSGAGAVTSRRRSSEPVALTAAAAVVALLGALGLPSALHAGASVNTAGATVPLVAEGEAQAVIVLPAAAQEDEQRAAEELREHIELISGAALEVIEEAAPEDRRLPLYIGSAADEALDEANEAAKVNPSTFTLRVEADRIDIRGLDSEGTLFGVYELLEQLGVRWYMPGEIGRVVPEAATLELERQVNTQAPSMDFRRLQNWVEGDWPRRVRLGGEPRSTGSHSLPHHEVRNSRADGYPALGTEGRQVCVSGYYAPGAKEGLVEHIRQNHEPTDERFYVGMGPEDGGAYAYCKCEGCVALDRGVHDPFFDVESVTDRYIWFFNQVLDELEDDYPNLHIAWYVYQRHMMPPKIEPNPRIVHVFAPITLDRIRGMDNPMSPDRHMLRWLIDEWSETNPNEMYYRGYYNNLACPQFPKTQLDRVRHEIPALHERGVNVMRVEVIRHAWASDPLTLYVASRMMWDVDTDVDALLEEFYEKFYGPAAAPMRRYHEGLESAFRDTPYLTGSSYVYFPTFKRHARRDELRGLLDEAVSLVEEGSVYAERMSAIRKGYERMDLFLDMMKARNEHDFATAYAKLEPYEQLTDDLVDHVIDDLDVRQRWVPRLLAWRERSENPGSYFNRFFADAIHAGHKRAVEDGQIVATLPDEWDFLLDPAQIGEIAGYHRPGELGGNWRPMRTSTRSWSDQGLHYYKGVAWYRTSVTIPAEQAGQPLYLWFGGVDSIAHVWINGQFVGTSREPEEGLPGVPGSFRPFDMPATDAAKPGEENWVVVKIENETLAELGTGGILAPVMFWSPNDPDWSPNGSP